MTIEHAYYISQIIAAIALIASIAFLALQVRHSTRLIQQAMIEDYRRNSNAIFDEVFKSRDFADFHMKIGSQYDALDAIDKYRAEFMAQKAIPGIMHTIRSRNDGFIPDAEWDEFVFRLRFIAKRKHIQNVWQKVKHIYPESLQRAYEDCAKQ
jgi:hypothetical protein